MARRTINDSRAITIYSVDFSVVQSLVCRCMPVCLMFERAASVLSSPCGQICQEFVRTLDKMKFMTSTSVDRGIYDCLH